MGTFIAVSGSKINVELIASYRRRTSQLSSIVLTVGPHVLYVGETTEEIDALIEEAYKKEAERKREEKQAEYETVLGWAKRLYDEIYHAEPAILMGPWPIQPMPPRKGEEDEKDNETESEAETPRY